MCFKRLKKALCNCGRKKDNQEPTSAAPSLSEMKTLIFGAGASIPFFDPHLSTSFLTSKIKDIAEWNRVISIYKSKTNNSIASASDIVKTINDIISLMPQANFEQIAEVVDKLSSYGFDQTPGNNMMNLIISVLQMEGALNKSNSSSILGAEWRDVPFIFREIIAEAILDLEKSHRSSDYNLLLQKQKEFIRYVCSKTKKINVTSFNYDDCVIDSLTGLDFELGFYTVNNLYLRQMDMSKFMPAARTVCFPHGHLKFQLTDDDNVSFWHSSTAANQTRWDTINGMMLGSSMTVFPDTFAYNFNTFLTTGQTKDAALNHLPYAAYYQKLAADLCQSDTVCIIGYSFGDAHVNRLLRSFLKINPNNTAFIIDYYPNPITMVDEYVTENHLLNKVHLVLGTDWQIRVSPSGQKRPIDEEAVRAINNNGYGEIFSQVVFYKKGYAAFLDEYKDVLHLS